MRNQIMLTNFRGIVNIKKVIIKIIKIYYKNMRTVTALQ